MNNHPRGVATLLAPAFLATLTGVGVMAFSRDLTYGLRGQNHHVVVLIALFCFVLTSAGSAFLSEVFDSTKSINLNLARYAIVFGSGVLAGGGLLFFVGAHQMGAMFGALTAFYWVLVHHYRDNLSGQQSN